jgi:hypothetical protein
MSLMRNFKAIQFATIALAALAANPVSAQKTCKNLYPCGECAVFDNNGNDLAGFTTNYKKQLFLNGSKVNEFSGGEWGYLLVRTANVPSVSTKWETKGNLNHAAPIRTTLVMNKTKDGAMATWWARECNTDNGAMLQLKTKDERKVEMEQSRYDKLMGGLLGKKFTLVEYLDTFNMRDYDYLLKNHIVSQCGTIKQDDYKGMIAYFNNFLSKFSYVDDPVVAKMSFIAFYEGASKTQYVAYFNVANSKLSGKLEAMDIQYERDRDIEVRHIFKHLTGKTVYVFGDNSFGLDKSLIRYAKNNEIKLRRRKVNTTSKFNNEQ